MLRDVSMVLFHSHIFLCASASVCVYMRCLNFTKQTIAFRYVRSSFVRLVHGFKLHHSQVFLNKTHLQHIAYTTVAV